MKRLILLTGILFLGNFLSAQTTPVLDTVYLMSGRIVTGVVKDSANEELKILVPKKGNFKADFIDLDLVYSVKYGTGVESVFYKQDSIFGNVLSAHAVELFIEGERDAMRGYRCPVWTAGSFVAGFAGGYSQSFVFTFLPPFIYSGATTFFRVKVKTGSVSNPNFLMANDDNTYLMGYEKEARKHRVFRSLLWGGIGMVTGFATSSIVHAVQ